MVKKHCAMSEPEVGGAGRWCRESASQGLEILSALYPATALGQRCIA